ncbi:MAG: type II toxin-antitoxin system VapC family toxin [Thermomicrobiales bacterium]
MRYLIDSDVVIDFLADDPQTVTLLRSLTADGIAVSIISYIETYHGVIESGMLIEQRAFDAFFAGVPVLPVSPETARQCAHLRVMLKRQGKSFRKRAFDLVVAATALEHGLELVTHNTDDYKDIPHLTLHQS